MMNIAVKCISFFSLAVSGYLIIQSQNAVSNIAIAQNAATVTATKGATQNKITSTQTPTATQSAKNTVQTISFKPSSAPLPKDILQQLMTLDPGSLGGGAKDCKLPEGSLEYQEPINNLPETAYFYQKDSRSPEIISGLSFVFSPAGPLSLESCGWPVGEVVTVTIRRPDGSIFYSKAERAVATSVESPSSPSGFIDTGSIGLLWPVITPPNPTGKYTITFTGSKQNISSDLLVEAPPYGGIYDTRQLDDSVTIYGYQPLERISILVYENIGALDFKNWQSAQVDNDGKLRLILPKQTQSSVGIEDCIIVVGEYTFESMTCFAQNDQLLTDGSSMIIGAVNTPVKWVKPATGTSRLVVRSNPNAKASEVTRVSSETLLSVDQRVYVPDEAISWWRVKLPDGRTGWVNGKFVVPLRRQ